MTRFLLGGWCATWALLVLSPSAHAQACETDADCPDGLACERGPSVSEDCGPGPCDAGAPVSAGGNCEAQVVTCAADADCPLGLTCEDQGQDVSVGCTSTDPGNKTPPADAGSDASPSCEAPEPVARERACSFNPDACKTDADCEQAGFGCLEVQSGASCDSSGQPSCAPGADCPDAAAPEPDCGATEVIRYCFPKRDDCTKESDCKSDWACTELPEDARKDPPPSWKGATQICLPVGLALAITGKIELGDSDFRGGSGSSDSNSLAASDTGGAKSTAEVSPATNKKKDDGGCTVANVGRARASTDEVLALLALLSVCGLVLRRAQHRSRGTRRAIRSRCSTSMRSSTS